MEKNTKFKIDFALYLKICIIYSPWSVCVLCCLFFKSNWYYGIWYNMWVDVLHILHAY